MREETDCVFCRILLTPSEQRPIWDTVLYETSECFVVPALGALEVGHVHVVSRRHVLSFAQATEAARASAQVIIDTHCRDVPHVVSEHGAYEHDSAGQCIAHAHISLLPSPTPIAGPGSPDRTGTSLAVLQEVTRPYLLLGYQEGYDVYLEPEIRSQYVRRMYCESVGRDDWDWAATPGADVAEQTVRRLIL